MQSQDEPPLDLPLPSLSTAWTPRPALPSQSHSTLVGPSGLASTVLLASVPMS